MVLKFNYQFICKKKTHRAIYLIINNGNHKKIENVIKKYNKTDIEIKNKTKYIIVDGTLKLSASVA